MRPGDPEGVQLEPRRARLDQEGEVALDFQLPRKLLEILLRHIELIWRTPLVSPKGQSKGLVPFS